MPLSTHDWLEFLYQAEASIYGISIAVNEPVRAKNALYRARRDSGDDTLRNIQIRTSPVNPTGELWLVKAKPEDISNAQEE